MPSRTLQLRYLPQKNRNHRRSAFILSTVCCIIFLTLAGVMLRIKGLVRLVLRPDSR